MSNISDTFCLIKQSLFVHSMFMMHDNTIILLRIITYYLIKLILWGVMTWLFVLSLLISVILLPYSVNIFQMLDTMLSCGFYCSISSYISSEGMDCNKAVTASILIS